MSAAEVVADVRAAPRSVVEELLRGIRLYEEDHQRAGQDRPRIVLATSPTRDRVQ